MTKWWWWNLCLTSLP